MKNGYKSDRPDLIASAARQFSKARRFSYASLKPDLTIDQVEQDFDKMIGRSNETMGGKRLNELLWEFVGAEDALEEILQGKRPQLRLEHVNREQQDGTIRYLTFVITLLEESRVGDGLLLVVEDTTDYGTLHRELVQDRNKLRLIRQQLAEVNETLIEMNRMKSLLLSMAAHDLRGPLTSIHAFAELLKDDVSGRKRIEFLDIIASQSERLRRLINDLLDVDQIEQGKLLLNLRECDFNDIIREVVAVLRPTAELRKQALVVDLADQPATLPIDSERMTQVVYNLIDNAINYTPEGGQIQVTSKYRHDSYELEVADNGPGIVNDQIAHLFSLYYRLDNACCGAVPGSGLGLFIVKTLVEAHQGEVSVESELGQGTSFTIRLTKPSSQEEELRTRLAALEAENEEARQKLERQPEVIIKEKDRLTEINGIGPVFARRFNEAGIYTFAELASITPERARDIINPQEWQAIHPESWIAEAEQLTSTPA